MQLRLKTVGDVRLFASAITFVAVAGNFALSYLILPPEVNNVMQVPGTMITIILAAPIAYFVGSKMLDVERLTKKLEHAAAYDPLTGASTRLSFYKLIADCQVKELALIVADIDHFKRVNDQYGHQAGDAALKSFAATLFRHCRSDDIIARFGGEEFVILLKNATQSEAAEVARRLSQKVREKPLHFQGRYVQITASFGVAGIDDIALVDRAIHHADLAVYRAKTTGRDRVCEYDPVLDAEPVRLHAAARVAATPGP